MKAKEAKTRTEQILAAMHILVWVAFIGYLIETGAVLVTYGISWNNPEAAKDVYGMNYYNLRMFNFLYYTHSISFVVALSLMKAYVGFLAIKVLSKISLTNPFAPDVVQHLEKISYVLLGTWVVGMISRAYADWLMKVTGELFGSWVSAEFLLMAGLVLVIAKIFRRGVEIQSENELTV